MPEYKLYYFEGRGLAEVCRQLFAISNTPFEDIRVPVDKWPEYQNKMPFRAMPVLEVDGQMIPQSVAIARYIARKTGHAGSSHFEEAIVDALADQYRDFYADIKPYYYGIHGFNPVSEEELSKINKEIFLPAKEKFFGFMTAFLQKSSSGFLAGNELTFADLILAEHVSTMKVKLPDYTEGFPEIETHLKKVHAIPELKKWLDSRPVTPF